MRDSGRTADSGPAARTERNGAHPTKVGEADASTLAELAAPGGFQRSRAALALQSSIGNRAVQRLVEGEQQQAGAQAGSPQPAGGVKLKIGKLGEGPMELSVSDFALGGASSRTSEGQVAGKAQLTDLSFRRPSDGTSTLFLNALRNNDALGNIRVEVPHPTKGTILSYDVSDAFVAKFDQGGAAGGKNGPKGNDEVSIGFRNMEAIEGPSNDFVRDAGPRPGTTVADLSFELKHRGKVKIPVASYSFGANAQMDEGTDTPRGKTQATDLTITKPMDELSHSLMQSFLNNEGIGAMVLEVHGGGKPSGGEVRYDIDGVALTAVSQSSPGGGGTETVSFGFQSMHTDQRFSDKEDAVPGAAEGSAKLRIGGLDATTDAFPINSYSFGDTNPFDAVRSTPATGEARTSASPSRSRSAKSAPNSNKAWTRTASFTDLTLNAPGADYSLKNIRISSVQMSGGNKAPPTSSPSAATNSKPTSPKPKTKTPPSSTPRHPREHPSETAAAGGVKLRIGQLGEGPTELPVSDFALGGASVVEQARARSPARPSSPTCRSRNRRTARPGSSTRCGTTKTLGNITHRGSPTRRRARSSATT